MVFCPTVTDGASMMASSLAEGPEIRGEPGDPRAAGQGHELFKEGTGSNGAHEREL